MRLPELNNHAVVRSYIESFERRFVQTGEEVIYQPPGGARAVRLSAAQAAELIAGMRATLFEVDEANPLWGFAALPAAAAVATVLMVTGFVLDLSMAGVALVLPGMALVLLAGPALGHVRAAAAWRRGLAEVERSTTSLPTVPTATVATEAPPNPVRPIFIVVVVLLAALLVGIVVAATGMSAFERSKLGMLATYAAWPLVVLVAGLGLASHSFDAVRRRRVSEAEIAAALMRRGDRPIG